MSGKATVVLMAISGVVVGLAIAVVQGLLIPVGPSQYGAVQLVTVELAATALVIWAVFIAFWSARTIRELRKRLRHLEEAAGGFSSK